MDRGTDRMWYIYIMEYYSVVKKDKSLSLATCMDLEDMMPSEITMKEKTNTV